MQLPAFDVNAEMNVTSMADIQQWFVDNKYVSAAADLNKVVDTTYLDYALSQEGKR